MNINIKRVKYNLMNTNNKKKMIYTEKNALNNDTPFICD